MLFSSFTKLSLLTTVFTSLAKANDLPPISVIGNKFFYPNGSQFYIRGVAYQANPIATVNSTFIDPLADKTTCARDIPYLEAVNTNVIRVYALDVEADHSGCMQLLQDAGIYVIADLAEPRTSISTTDPEWNLDLYERYTAVIDMMQDYSNVLGFFAGNEVVTNNTNTDSAPFVKAAIRDMKRYMAAEGYRAIPIGYSANDDADTRTKSAEYFNCGDSDEVKADLYGINMYEWCGASNFQTSGYADRTEEFSNLTIPVFFSEYGCNTVQPRKFTEIGTIFGSDMTDVWSGGIVYMYFEEENNYGLVSAIDSTSVSTMTDYIYYSSEMNDISPTSATSADITVSTGNYACPATDSDWKAATALPPTPQSGVCDCMSKSLSCVVSDNVSSDDYSDLFATVCGLVDCSGITGDGETGEYGAYSFCSSKDMLSFVINLYYQEQHQASSACDFSGSASLQSGTTASSCSSVLSAAGTLGTGAITGTVSGSGSGSSSTASNASSTRSASRSSSSSSHSATSSSSSSSGGKTSTGTRTSADFNVIFAVGAVVVACVSAIVI